MPTQKQLQKKKQREKESKEKVAARRAVLRAPRIEENKFKKKVKRVAKLQKNMGELSLWDDAVLLRMDNAVLAQLERNAEILKGLEAEYEKEKSKKNQINEELEQKGLFTLEQKMNYLHEQLVEQQKAAAEDVLTEEEWNERVATQSPDVVIVPVDQDVGCSGMAECKCHPATVIVTEAQQARADMLQKEIAEIEVLKAPTLDLKESSDDLKENS